MRRLPIHFPEPLTPQQCAVLVVSALEKQRRARRAPMLAAKFPSLAVWSWPHQDPARWNAYHSLDGGATFVLDDFVSGNERQFAPDGGQYPMFIVGVDAGGKEITARSNVVIPDSALYPAPELAATYPSLATWSWGYTNPAFWAAYHSLDGGQTFVLDDYTAGANRQYAPDGGQYPMFIVGVDAALKEVTERSNFVVPDSAAAPSLLGDLVAYWPLDESSPGTRLDAVDGLELVEVQDAVGVAAGVIGNGVNCGRVWDTYSDLGLGYPRALRYTDTAGTVWPSGDFSMQLWFNPTYQNGFTGWMLCFVANPGTDNLRYEIYFNYEQNPYAPEVCAGVTGNAAQFPAYQEVWPYAGYLDDNGSEGRGTIYTGVAPAVGLDEALHIVLTKDITDVKAYVNGVLCGSVANPGNLSSSVAPQLFIGGAWWTYEADGIADEVGIWHRALNATEVAALYNSGNGLAYGGF